MANSIQELFHDIAVAIRGKDNSTAAITARDFPNRINNIPQEIIGSNGGVTIVYPYNIPIDDSITVNKVDGCYVYRIDYVLDNVIMPFEICFKPNKKEVIEFIPDDFSYTANWSISIKYTSTETALVLGHEYSIDFTSGNRLVVTLNDNWQYLITGDITITVSFTEEV